MRFALVATLALAATAAHAQIDASVVPDDAPEWEALDAAIADATSENKVLLLHGYAKWCGWCARLDQEVYTDDAVQAYLAENFEVTRLDIENRTTVDFFDFRLPMAWLASGIGITSTPTTIFVDAQDGEIITRLPGYADRETFLYALRFVREGAYETMSFQDFIDAEEEKAGGVTAGDDAAPLIPLVD